MRTALLAAVRRTASGRLRAELDLGGRSVLAWQVELVRSLGCERIVCLCEAPGGEVLARQKQVEREGGTFHAIRSNLQLASLVRADDELVMMSDGLVADRATVWAQTGFAPDSREPLTKGIATMPDGHPLAERYPDDFERIDRDRHWAGLAVMRAAQVHKLADLPPDGEPMSLLLRLGLQARVEGQPVPPEALDNGSWILATDENALVERELALIEGSAGIVPWTGPARAAAASLVQRLAPRWLDNGSEVSGLAGAALMLSGIVLIAFGMAPLGLGMAALGAFGIAMGEAWAGLRDALWSQQQSIWPARLRSIAPDALAACALVLAHALPAGDLEHAALPLLAVGLARFLGAGSQGAIAAFWRDRAFQLAVFAVAAAFGFLGAAIALFALGALLQLLLRNGAD